MRLCARTVAALGLTVVASACSLIQKRPVPEPFEPNPPYGEIVRDIELEGNRYTRESVIRDGLVSRVGEPYTEQSAIKDYRRLFQLGVFTRVQFRTEPAEEGITLITSMDEVSPYLPTISFAISQENGLEIGPSFSSPNLFGRTTKSSVYARFGGANNFGIRFRDPWRVDRDWIGCCYDLQFFRRQRTNQLDEFEEVSDELFLQYLLTVSERFRVGPRFTYIALRAKEDSLGNRPDVVLDPDGTDNIPGLGIMAEYDTRDLVIYPTTGWYIGLDALQHGGFLGGASDYFRTNLDIRRYFQLAGSRHSLALYSLLTLTSGQVGVEVPIHQDYHIGGTNSVRGWPLDSRNGQNQWLNTVEYWWKLIPRTAYQVWFIKWSMGLQLAAFADLGTAWNAAEEYEDHWIAGAGLGARLVIPQAVMIRFDLAIGRLEPGFELAFHVGGNEKAFGQKQRVR